MDIELRHLRIICVIAESGSVTKAAAVLGLAPPALTTALQRIERALGASLFDRDRHGARPTPFGEIVLARARLLLPAVSGLRDEATRLSGGDEARYPYRIGATNGPIVGGLIQRISSAHPQAHIATHASWSAQELAGKVGAGSLDYALVGVCGNGQPPEAPGLVWRTVCVDAVCVLVAETHDMAGRDEVELGELAGELWANAPGDGCFTDCFTRACARAGFLPRHVFETDVAGCLDLLEAGTAVVLCQGTFRPRPGIAMVTIAGTPLSWRHMLGWRPDGPAAAVAEEVAGFAAAAYTEVVARNPVYLAWLGQRPGLGLGAGQAVSVQVSM
jgi:DNA-binding transcriptional LysR family regulator